MTSEPRKSVCLYQRDGPHWWRVDADISADGSLTVTSGDTNEWQAIVDSRNVPALLGALRREGDLLPAIGGDADDEILDRLLIRFVGRDATGPFEDIKAYLDSNDIPWTGRFWAGDADASAGDATAVVRQRGEMAAILREALALVRRSHNDFTWSSWDDAAAAAAELQDLLERLDSEPGPVAATLAVILAPAGPLQELALSSGWAEEYLDLARRADATLAEAAARHGCAS